MGFSDHMKVMLGVDTKGFNSGLSKAEKRAGNFGNIMKTKVLPFLGAAALARSAKEVVNFGAAIGDMSDRLGVGTEFLQKFQYAAGQNGIASEEAGIALQRFTRRVADAKANGGKLAETLDNLGIQFEDSSGRAKTSEELFQEFGSALAGMNDPAEKLRVAFQFLDTEGAKLTQLFRDGVPSIQEYGKEAEKLGIIVKDDQVKALQGASGAMEEMGRTFKSFLATAATPITVAIKGINEVLKTAISVVKNYGTEIAIAATAVTTYFGALKALKAGLAVTELIKGMGIAAAGTSKTMKLLAIATNAVFTGNFAKGAKAAMVAFKAFSLALAANPVGLFVTALAAASAPLILFKKQLSDATEEGRRMAKVAEGKFKEALAKMSEEINSANIEIRDMGQRLRELRNDAKDPVEVNLETRLEELKQANETVRDGEKALRRRLRALADEEEIQLRVIQHKKDNNRETNSILDSERNLKRTQQEKQKVIQQLLQMRIDEAQNLKEIEATEQAIADKQKAKELGIDKILKGTQKETLELERQTELLEAAKTGNQELLDKVRERHQFQDEVARLVEQENMGIEEAAELVRKRMEVDKELEAAEKAIAEAIEQQKGAKQGVNEEAQRAIEQAQQEKAIHEQNKKIFNDQLRVLKLRAQGRDEDADILEKQLENEKEIKNIMEQQGVNQVDAIDLLKQKLKLEQEITQELLDQKIAAIRDKALDEGRDLNDMGASDRAKKLREMDKEERQRARDKARADRLRERLKGDLKPGEDRDKMQKMLDDLKDKLLTDEQKKEIEKIKKQKKEAEDRAKKIQADIDKKKKEAEKAVADAAKKEKEKLDKVLDAGENAIKEAGKDIAKEIKRIKAPKIDTAGIEAAIDGLAAKINAKGGKELPDKDYPDGSDPGVNTPQDFKDMFDGLATEDTLAKVHTALQGKFVNQ